MELTPPPITAGDWINNGHLIYGQPADSAGPRLVAMISDRPEEEANGKAIVALPKVLAALARLVKAESDFASMPNTKNGDIVLHELELSKGALVEAGYTITE